LEFVRAMKISTRSFRGGSASAFTRVFDALSGRTRNPDTTFGVCVWIPDRRFAASGMTAVD
jgi:hypothetical protein